LPDAKNLQKMTHNIVNTVRSNSKHTTPDTEKMKAEDKYPGGLDGRISCR